MTYLFVTGITGFIGKNFLDRVQMDDSISLLCLLDKNDLVGREMLKEKGIKYIYVDQFPEYNGQIDICYHLASYGVEYGKRNIDLMINVNVVLAKDVFFFASKHGCKCFFNIGSCFEYGTQGNKPIKEDTLLLPEDLYASTKVACEILLKSFAKELGIKFITLRPFSVYGKYEPSYRLYPLILNTKITGKPLKLTKGEQIRDYLNVTDLADIMYKIMINNNKIDFNIDAINLCSGKGISVHDFVVQTAIEHNIDLSLFEFGKKEYRPNESMYFVGDNTKLKSIIGSQNYLY